MRNVAANTQGIDYFYRGHWLTRHQIQASLRVRRSIFTWAIAQLPPGRLRVLELGATPDTQRADSNCFARWFIERGDDVALASVECLDNLRDVFATAQIISWSNLDHFARTFDLVVSSAVIEHTGNGARDHLALALRLGRNVLLTTPNRWHWLEFHTKLPLVHWLPPKVHRKLLRLLGMAFWAEERNLRLYSYRELRTLVSDVIAERGVAVEGMEWYFPRWCGWVSNLVLLCKGVR